MDPPNANIKQEEEIIEIETTSSENNTSTTSSLPPETNIHIDEDDLQILSSKHSSKRRYPPTCPVWYSLSSKTKRLDACRGVVKAVYTNLESGGFVYKITKRNNHRNNNKDGNTTTVTTPNCNSQKLYLTEDQLSYAMNCPVKVKGIDQDDPSKEIDGTIVCPRPLGKSSGDRKFSYSVMLFLDENNVRVELGVDAEQITFRKEDVETTQRKEGTAKKEEFTRQSDTRPTQSEEGLTNIDEPTGTTRKRAGLTSVEEPPQKNDVKQDDNINAHETDNTPDNNTGGTASQVDPQNNNSNEIMDETSRDSTLIDRRKERCDLRDSTSGNLNGSNVKDITSDENDTAQTTKRDYGQNSQSNHTTSLPSPNTSAQLRSQTKTGNDHEHNNTTFGSLSTTQITAKNNNYYGPGVEKQLGTAQQNDHHGPPIEHPNNGSIYQNKTVDASTAGSNSGIGGANRGNIHQKPSQPKSWVPPAANPPSLAGHEKSTIPRSFPKHSYAAMGGAPNSGSNPRSLSNAPPAEAIRTQPSEGDHPNSGVYCKLTVPLWVTDTSTKSLFHHIVGRSERGIGFKTKEIENKTGCSVGISRPDRNKDIPTYITLKPIRYRFEMVEAREMIEDSLLEFLECEGSRARLMYELAASLDGASNLGRANGCVVQQRMFCVAKDLVWMNLIEVPAGWSNSNMMAFENQGKLHSRVYAENQCMYKVFCNELGNMNMPVTLCRPFVLIWGATCSSEQAAKATEMIAKAIKENFQTQQNNDNQRQHAVQELSQPIDHEPSRKRKQLPDAFKSSDSAEQRPPKASKDANNSDAFSEQRPPKNTCVLTVPLWATQNCTPENNLYGHLLGYGGGKIRSIQARTKCSVKLIDKTPLVIKIAGNDFSNVRGAKKMIEESILDFLGDSNSERRLLYDLAMGAKGTFNFPRSGSTIQQDCPFAESLVWMNLLELPSAESNGQRRHHGVFLSNEDTQGYLLGNTNCSVEVYVFRDRAPVMTEPYVLIWGDRANEVNQVAKRVLGKLEEHMQRCARGCQYQH